MLDKLTPLLEELSPRELAVVEAVVQSMRDGTYPATAAGLQARRLLEELSRG